MDWKRAIGYIRVSTEKQAEDDKFGIEAQKVAINAYCREHGYYIDKWIEEVGCGAEERPLMDELVWGDTIDGDYKAVIVFKNDRVARDTKLYFTYLYQFEKKGVKLISTQEEFDEGSDFANIYRALLQFVAEQERKNISKRTSAGRKAKATVGGYAGGKAPYGYKVEHGALVIDDEEAEWVREIFRRLDQKDSCQQIADALNTMGVPTRTGKNKWQRVTIAGIKNNKKTYEGMYRYSDGDWVKGLHQPILERKIVG